MGVTNTPESGGYWGSHAWLLGFDAWRVASGSCVSDHDPSAAQTRGIAGAAMADRGLRLSGWFREPGCVCALR